VYVNPGYALDCCGNDLVVCGPIAVDLAEICKPHEDPCERPTKPKDTNKKPQPEAGTEGDCWQTLGRKRDLVAVDLFLRYHEDLTQPQRPMFRSGCADDTRCEYTRVLENPCVHAELGSLDRACDDDEAQEWQRWFEGKNREARQTIAEATRLGLRDLLKHVRKHPPFKFCFMEDLICCLIEEHGRDKAHDRAQVDLQRVAFWLYLDWLLHFLECPCPTCRPDKGVPIARVILRRPEAGGRAPCRVVVIDPTWPYRRPLRSDECRPIPRGTIDLVPYLWQPERVAIDRLGALGVQVEPGTKLDESDQYAQFESASVLLETGVRQRIRTLSVADLLDCRRVVGFEVAHAP